MFTFQNCELLAEGKVLQHQAAATAKSANDGSAPGPKQIKHGSQVIADGILSHVSDVVEFKGGRNCDEGQFESSAITTLINGPSGLWSIGLSAVGTVVDVGRRCALTDQAQAAYDYQVASYRENVLTGFQRVEDNLVAVRILEHEAQVQDEAVKAA